MVGAEVLEREGDTRALEAELAEWAGMANATAARITQSVATALVSGAWEGWGIRSPKHWVTWKCGVSSRSAAQVVVVAKRWSDLPSTMAVFVDGGLSIDQVAVICRHVPAYADAEVAVLAPQCTVAPLKRVVSKYTWTPDPDIAAPAPAPETRRVGFGFDEDGTWRAGVVLPPDEGAVVEQALVEAKDRLYRQRQAAGEEHPEVTWADAMLAVADGFLANVAAGRVDRDRYLTLIHLEAGHDGEPLAQLHKGPTLPDALRRLLTCDGRMKPVTQVGGVAVSVGRAQRIVPDRTRILVEHRDQGCRVPGCDRRRTVQVHHIIHWEDGGPTDTINLVCLCPRHHRMHHHGFLGIQGDPDDPFGLTFTDPRGRTLASHGRPNPPPDRTNWPTGHWRHPTGEPLHTKWIDFAEPTAPTASGPQLN